MEVGFGVAVGLGVDVALGVGRLVAVGEGDGDVLPLSPGVAAGFGVGVVSGVLLNTITVGSGIPRAAAEASTRMVDRSGREACRVEVVVRGVGVEVAAGSEVSGFSTCPALRLIIRSCKLLSDPVDDDPEPHAETMRAQINSVAEIRKM